MEEARFGHFSDFVGRIGLTDAGPEAEIFVLHSHEISEQVLDHYPAYRNDFYEINLIQRQRFFRFTIDGVSYQPDGRPYVCFVAPSQLQSYEVVGEDPDAEGYIIYILRSVFEAELSQGHVIPFFKRAYESYYELSAAEFEELYGWVRLLYQEFKRPQPHQRAVLKALLDVFLLKALSFLGKVDSILISRPEYIAERFLDLVRRHKASQKSVGFYADLLALSPKTLNEITKKALGKNALRLIHEQTVEEAKHLLRDTNLTVKEIAFRAGFEELPHFSRIFKRLTGSSPAAFRSERPN